MISNKYCKVRPKGYENTQIGNGSVAGVSECCEQAQLISITVTTEHSGARLGGSGKTSIPTQ